MSYVIEAIYVQINTLKPFGGNRGDYFMTLEQGNIYSTRHGKHKS